MSAPTPPPPPPPAPRPASRVAPTSGRQAAALRARRGRVRDALLGLSYVGLVLAIGLGTWASYEKVFTRSSEITLSTSSIGNALQKGSDVKLNGVPVGEVRGIEATDSGARLTLALKPDVLDQLPRNTVARLLPKTLFGERYVALVRPRSGVASASLEAGDRIEQDSSASAVEVEDLFDKLLPVLQAIQPDKLSATLGELALMLRGNGDRLGATLASFSTYLGKLTPITPQLADDLASLGRVADTYATAAPDLVDALTGFTTTAKTVAEKRTSLAEVFSRVTTAADDADAFVTANSRTIIRLSDSSRAGLEAIAPYAVQFPCLSRSMRDLIPVMDKVLGKGTKQPGLHVVLSVTPDRGRYRAGRDDIRYAKGGAPRCPYQDGSVKNVRGRVGTTGAAGDPAAIAPPPSPVVAEALAAGRGLGEANSPAENQLIAELMAPEAGVSPADYPAFASLMVGPLLRGTEVEVR